MFLISSSLSPARFIHGRPSSSFPAVPTSSAAIRRDPVLRCRPISRSYAARPAPFACAGAAGYRRPCCARACRTAGLTSALHRRGLALPRGCAPLPASKPAAEAPASGAGAAHHGCYGNDLQQTEVEDDGNYEFATQQLFNRFIFSVSRLSPFRTILVALDLCCHDLHSRSKFNKTLLLIIYLNVI